MHRLPKWTVGFVAIFSATLLAGGTASSSTAAPPRPMPRPAFGAPGNAVTAAARSVLLPNRSPAGSNRGCRPSAAHPNPVVLVHGTVANAYDSWSGLAPVLEAYGYCVYAVNFGGPSWSIFKGIRDIPTSAVEIGRFVDDVRRSTGAAKVDLVGHSQGGSVSRYYANLIGGSTRVSKVVALAPSNHATTVSGMMNLGRFLKLVDPVFALTNWMGAPALQQQTDAGSAFYRNLNGNGETRSGISYTNIATRYDAVVTPYRQSFLTAGAGAKVTNTTLQDVCGNDRTDHLGIIYDSNVYQMVLNALDPGDQRPVDCRPAYPLFGT